MTWTYIVRAVELVGQDALSAVVVAALALLPGWGLASALADRLGWGLEAAGALAFTLTAAFGGIACSIGAVAGVGLVPGMVLVAALGGAGWYLAVSRHAPLLPRPRERGGLVLAAVAAGLAVIEGPYMGLTADAFYHLAAVRTLVRTDTLNALDAIVAPATKALDPATGVLNTLLAMWTRLTGLDPAFLWGGLNALAAAAVVLALWVLLRALSGSGRIATVVTSAWLVFAQYGDLRTAAYPNMASLAFVFVTLAACVALAEAPGPVPAAAVALGALGVLATHLGSAQLIVVALTAVVAGLAVVALARRLRGEEPGLSRALWAAGALVAALVAAAPLLVSRVLTVSPTGLGSGLGDAASSAAGLLVSLPGGLSVVRPGAVTPGGPALAIAGIVLGVLAIALALRPGAPWRTGVAAAVAAIPLAVLYDPLIVAALGSSPYMMVRLGALLGFTAFAGVAWALGGQPAPSARLAAVTRWAAYAVLAAAVIGAGISPLLTFVRIPGAERHGARYPVYVSRLIDVRYIWGEGLTRTRAVLDAGSEPPVVGGDPETTYYLSGLADFVPMARLRSHSTYATERSGGPERRADAAALLAMGASEADRRAILERWDVSYVVFWLDRAPQAAAYADMKAQTGLFEPAVSSEHFAMLKVVR